VNNASPSKIRVVIAEDQEMVLGALASLLDMEDDIAVVALARDGRQALEAVRAHTPDVLITDIEMPVMTGLDTASALKGSSTRVIIVTTFARPGYLRRAMDAGAHGYLLKARPARDLADAVRRIHHGLRVIDPDLATEAWAEADPLTERERQVLRLTADGVSTAAVAKQLNLSAGTVRNYLSEAIEKLGAANRIDAVRIARDKGWL
jgi:two-component system response regulator DesR